MGLATCKHRQLSNPHMMVKFPSQTPIYMMIFPLKPLYIPTKKCHTDKRPQTVWGGKKLIYQTQATVVKQ
jgi:hypothetical protein